MRTSTSTTKWLVTILLLFALVFPACAPARPDVAASYGREGPLHLDANQPAPFAGWLVSDADLEWLLKAAEGAARSEK